MQTRDAVQLILLFAIPLVAVMAAWAGIAWWKTPK